MGVLVHHSNQELNLQTNNEQLKIAIKAAGLTQAEALARWNEGQARPLAASTWKAYLGNPDSIRYRKCPDYVLSRMQDVLKHLDP